MRNILQQGNGLLRLPHSGAAGSLSLDVRPDPQAVVALHLAGQVASHHALHFHGCDVTTAKDATNSSVKAEDN